MGEKHSTAGLSLLWIHRLPSPGAERTHKYAVFTDKEIEKCIVEVLSYRSDMTKR